MKKAIKALNFLILGLLAVAFTFLTCSSNLDIKIGSRLMADYEYFWAFMDENFALWSVVEENGFNASAVYNKYKPQIEGCKTELDFAQTVILPITQEFQKSGAGHTTVLNSDTYRQLRAVSGQNISDLPKEALLGFDSDYLKSVQKRLDFEYEILSNSKFYDKFEFPEAQPESDKRYGKIIDCSILENNKTAYLDLNAMRYTESDKIKLNNFLNDIKNYKALIIDIRGNRGGSDEFWHFIVDKLSGKSNYYNGISVFNFQEYNRNYLLNCAFDKAFILLQNNLNLREQMDAGDLLHVQAYCNTIIGREFNGKLYNGFVGKIFLLTDKNTFSSADGFAAFCKNTNFATIVGQETGGDGAGGQLGLFSLPYTGIIIKYSIGYGLNSDYKSNIRSGTAPDYVIPINTDSLGFCMCLINS